MSFLGMGFLEILVVFLIGFVLLGPDRMMDMGKKAGKLVGELRRMSADLQDSISLAEIDDRPQTRHVSTPTGRGEETAVDNGPVSFKTGGEVAPHIDVGNDQADVATQDEDEDEAAVDDDFDNLESDSGLNGVAR